MNNSQPTKLSLIQQQRDQWHARYCALMLQSEVSDSEAEELAIIVAQAGISDEDVECDERHINAMRKFEDFCRERVGNPGTRQRLIESGEQTYRLATEALRRRGFVLEPSETVMAW